MPVASLSAASVAPAPANADKRPTVRGLEEGVDARLGVREQLPMRRLEARSAACGCRHDEPRPSVGPFYTVSCARE